MNGHSEVVVTFPNGESTSCPMCDSEKVGITIEEEEFVYGKGEKAATLHARVRVMKCSACGFSFTDETGEDARHTAVCRHLGVMTPGEVTAVRDQYHMTRAEFSTLTRLGEASLGRWENGTLIQNAAYDQLLFLLTYPENVERLRLSDRRGDLAIETGERVLRGQFGHFRSFEKVPDEVMRSAANFELRPTGT